MEEEILTPVDPDAAVEVVDIQFRPGQKIYYFDPNGIDCKAGDHVIIDTARGPEYGTVAGSNHRIPEKDVVAPLRSVIRKATEEDKKVYKKNLQAEKEAFDICLGKIADHKLDMHLVDVEYTFDGNKILFYFTADGRVDFRELIKKLAEEFHIRVEMRQIGFRQESAKLGGIGSCGRELCCSSWITNFQSVTTNVARVQQLSPNPQKLAGQCGKLKCCLNYEYDTYVDALKAFPDSHIVLRTKKGDASYSKTDVFKGLMWYSYVFDRNNMMAIPAEKVKEIIAMNNKGKMPEQLEDYAFIKEQRNTEYGEEGQNVDLSKLE